MGCISSKPDSSDVHANLFRVMNVDDAGQVLFSGQLEVTEVELILYQHAKTPVRWPLRCLRRYGYDLDIFTFESGRRCVTGPGIYAFKCHRAEQLFNLLQVHQ
jgi:fibroblast growth factor receptor substrate 2